MKSKDITDAFSFLGREVNVTIERQLGSRHPKWGFVYDSNYGYIENTLSPDGEELDAYLLGTDKPIEKASGKVIAIIHRTDDDDDKLVVSVDGKDINNDLIRKMTDFQEKFFKSEIIR
jgi:inorganic pyrophosphatase